MSVPWYLMAKGKGGGGYKTASGPIVSINDALAAPLRSLRVGIDPVQDLHGYDSPWPAGGGKNKFDVDKMVNTSDITISNGVITVTGNSKNSTKKLSELADLTIGEAYILTANTTGSENLIYLYGTGANVSWSFGTSKTITQEMLDALVFFYGGSGTTSQISNFMIRLSSVSDASFAPYSNLCPISGWTEANVWRTGKNLVPSRNVSRTDGDVQFTRNANGSVTAVGTASRNCWWHSGSSVTDWTFLRAGQYRLTGGISSDKRLYIIGVYVDGTAINYNTVTGGVYDLGRGLTFSLTKDAYITYQIQINSGTEVDDTFYLMISRDTSAVASDFTPYTGNQFTIQLGQTVYGGTLDVLNGVLRVDRAEVDLGTLTYSYQDDNKRFLFFVDGKKGEGDSIATPNFICSYYKPVTAYYFDGHKDETGMIRGSTALNGYMFLRDLSETNPTNLKTKLSGQTIVYELATPITIPLTDITISTLAGQNVMWADCGDVTVEYLSAGGANPDLMKLAVAFMGRK